MANWRLSWSLANRDREPGLRQTGIRRAAGNLPWAEEVAQAGDSTTMTFDSLAALNKVSADWQMSRFVEIWNSIPGQTPVKKFTDRKSAVTRIWKAIQPLTAHAQASAPKPQVEKPGKVAKSAKKIKAATKTRLSKPGGDKVEGSNKKVEVIAMMKRAKGATLAEIMDATNWQKHTVRGLVSILGSKGGFSIESSKSADGERTYKIAK